MALLGLPFHIPEDGECFQFPGKDPGDCGGPTNALQVTLSLPHVFLLFPSHTSLPRSLSLSRIPSKSVTDSISFAS